MSDNQAFRSVVYCFSSDMKRGLKVNQARAGKKIIGTASPVKSSGFLIDKGRETDIGIMTAANERIESTIWKTIILLLLELILKK
jgi:hypothetical protein